MKKTNTPDVRIGRPPKREARVPTWRVNLTLDKTTLDKLKVLGEGNLSAGVRIAVASVKAKALA